MRADRRRRRSMVELERNRVARMTPEQASQSARGLSQPELIDLVADLARAVSALREEVDALRRRDGAP